MVRLKYLVAFQIHSLDATCPYFHPFLRDNNTDDRPGESTDAVIWSFIEDYTTVICASLITIRPFLAKYIPSVFRNTIASQNHATHSTYRPHGNDSRSAAAIRSYSLGSAIELNSVESGKRGWVGRARIRRGRGLEARVMKSGLTRIAVTKLRRALKPCTRAYRKLHICVLFSCAQAR